MTHRRTAIFSLIAAGMLWGSSVPLSKLSIGWLGPGWLTVGRFALAAPVLAFVSRRHLRAAWHPRVIAVGALGFGGVIVLQNLGIAHTSVTHAAVLVGAMPVMVAVFTAVLGHSRPVGREWIGYAVASGGIVLVAGSGGGGATPWGDLLVLTSVVFSAVFIVLQPKVLDGRDPAAVTAVQFIAGAVVAVPFALLLQGAPSAPAHWAPVGAFVALAFAGTLLPFWLFAHGQSKVPAQLAGVFVNIEPVVGTAIGWIAFADPMSFSQLFGALSVIAGIALTALPRTPRLLAPIGRAWDEHVYIQERILASHRLL
jgi:O-acetylserine/cysteine efflux transporter